MRVVFMGTPAFAVPTLDALVAAGHEVLAVVSQPDRPSGRGRHVQSPPTVERARALGIPVKQPRAVRTGAFPAWIAGLEADVGVVVAYGRILVPAVLAAPRRGCVNVHGSLLPKYRGAAPIQWAVVNGEAETGITTMLMDAGLDTGDMLLKQATPIDPEETAVELADRLALIGASLLVETLARLDQIQPERQDDAAASLAPMLTREHGLLDWARPAGALHDQARGLQPWPGAWTQLRGEVLKVARTRLRPELGGGAPGVVLDPAAGFLVGTGGGVLEILEGQLPGKRVQAGRDLVNGARIQAGERLG